MKNPNKKLWEDFIGDLQGCALICAILTVLLLGFLCLLALFMPI